MHCSALIAYRSASNVLPIRSVEAVEAEGLYALGSYGPAVTIGGAFGAAASEAAPVAALDAAVGGIEAAFEFGVDTSLSASEFSVGYVGEGVLATAVGEVTGIATEGGAAA